MPKIKTHKGAARRFRATGSGKLVRMKRGSSHLRRKKPRAVRRLYKDTQSISPSQKRRVRALLPGVSS
ncbi:MAG: 50S ribosomal protein L35 [Chloroflexota bacterium]|nr:50S ribosomal protein L35 [Chloroflexota bacterium]